MRILVCVRRGADGELSPFEASAYECALRLGGEVLLLSMGPADCGEWLSCLTRLGAAGAYLLSDSAFAGSDTLATVTVLAAAVSRLKPDLILCGRKTLMGDTGQVGPGLAALLHFPLVQELISVPTVTENGLRLETRSGVREAPLPLLVTAERFCSLRFPSLFSRKAAVTSWDAKDLDLSPEVCGLAGSPTRVTATAENTRERRRCRMISAEELPGLLRECLQKNRSASLPDGLPQPLPELWWVGDDAPPAPVTGAARSVICLPAAPVSELLRRIRAEEPAALLFSADPEGRALACRIAAELKLGLCADVTGLESDGTELRFIRPALAGNVLATVRCLTRPALATVAIPEKEQERLLLSLGMGAARQLPELTELASRLSAGLGASRALVDSGLLPYPLQVGLTGRRVAPAVYLCVGISGAVQHTVGFSGAGTVIAVNPDRKAPIFDHADYGLIGDASALIRAFSAENAPAAFTDTGN